VALKNLTVEKSKLTEDAIESVVKDYIRYDPDALEIVVLPKFSNLDSRRKVLVYLAAVRGWPFVTEQPPDEGAKPAEIERHTRIQGGTLRPILKKLKDTNVVAKRSGKYVLPNHNISLVAEMLSQHSPAPAKQTDRKKPSGLRSGSKRTKKKSAKKHAGPGGLVQDLLRKGYFTNGRLLKDVQQRLAGKGFHYPPTSLSGVMQRLVQQELLHREKVKVGNRSSYQYTERQVNSG